MKSRLTQLASVFSIPFLLVSCSANVDMVKLQDGPPETEARKVELYASKDQVKQPFEELAIITVDDQGWGMSDEKLADELRKKAESIHADAVIISAQESQSAYVTSMGSGTALGNTVVGSGINYIGDKKMLRGIAIAFKETKPTGG